MDIRTQLPQTGKASFHPNFAGRDTISPPGQHQLPCPNLPQDAISDSLARLLENYRQDQPNNPLGKNAWELIVEVPLPPVCLPARPRQAPREPQPWDRIVEVPQPKTGPRLRF
jgi:hypothetical protein